MTDPTPGDVIVPVEKEVVYYRRCFVCGSENPIGLKLRFFSDGKVVHTLYRPAPEHEGYRHIAHGGIIATILDEVMIKAALALEIYCVTAQLDIRYRAPAPIEVDLFFEGRIASHKGRVIKTIGTVHDDSGRIYAEATGTYVTVSGEMEAKLLESLEQ